MKDKRDLKASGGPVSVSCGAKKFKTLTDPVGATLRRHLRLSGLKASYLKRYPEKVAGFSIRFIFE